MALDDLQRIHHPFLSRRFFCTSPEGLSTLGRLDLLDLCTVLTHEGQMTAHPILARSAALLIALVSPAVGQEQDKPVHDDHGMVAVSQGGKSQPYLQAGSSPDMSIILSPPPAPGTSGAEADQATFLATRSFDGTPRWRLATRDADADPKALLTDFACALGTDLGDATTPALKHLLDRVLGDAEVAFRTAKANVKRVRPLVGNQLPICVPRDDRLLESYSFPSGHATRGWTFALILAELAPEHGTAILTRGRVYGESRVICGAHWLSDIEAGRTVGAALVATLHGDAMFRADLEAARTEVNRALKTPVPPDDAECKVEQSAATAALR